MKRKRIIVIFIIFTIIAIASFGYASYVSKPIQSEYSFAIDCADFLNERTNNYYIEPKDKITGYLAITNITNSEQNYCVYLDKLDGKLQDYIIFSIYSEDELLYTNIAKEFNQANSFIPMPIKAKDKHYYTIIIEIVDNDEVNRYQGKSFKFDIKISQVKK